MDETSGERRRPVAPTGDHLGNYKPIDRLLWPLVRSATLYVIAICTVASAVPIGAGYLVPNTTLGGYLYLLVVSFSITSAIALHRSRCRWVDWFTSVTSEAVRPLQKRFFELDDGAYYLVVAHDPEHAVEIVRAAGIDFTCFGIPYDEAIARGDMFWRELSAADVARHERVHTQDDRGIIPLADARVGEWFCSEW